MATVIKIKFIHPTNWQTKTIAFDNSMTAQMIIDELVSFDWLPPDPKGYKLAFTNDRELPGNETLANAGVKSGVTLKVLGHYERTVAPQPTIPHKDLPTRPDEYKPHPTPQPASTHPQPDSKSTIISDPFEINWIAVFIIFTFFALAFIVMIFISNSNQPPQPANGYQIITRQPTSEWMFATSEPSQSEYTDFEPTSLPTDVPPPTYEPPPTEPSQETYYYCSGAPQPRVKIDDLARVTYNGLGPVRLRSSPEVRDDNIIERLPEGESFKITSGPTCAPIPGTNNSFVFWFVRVISTNQKGWVAEGDLDNYYIEPIN